MIFSAANVISLASIRQDLLCWRLPVMIPQMKYCYTLTVTSNLMQADFCFIFLSYNMCYKQMCKSVNSVLNFVNQKQSKVSPDPHRCKFMVPCQVNVKAFSKVPIRAPKLWLLVYLFQVGDFFQPGLGSTRIEGARSSNRRSREW